MLITEYIIRCDDCPLELDGQEGVNYAEKKAREAGWLIVGNANHPIGDVNYNEYYCTTCRGKYE